MIISLRNIKTLPKIEILVFFKNEMKRLIPNLLEKVVFLPPKHCSPPWAQG
jgi:hypothetical protein